MVIVVPITIETHTQDWVTDAGGMSLPVKNPIKDDDLAKSVQDQLNKSPLHIHTNEEWRQKATLVSLIPVSTNGFKYLAFFNY